jgi:hypothetical protein
VQRAAARCPPPRPRLEADRFRAVGGIVVDPEAVAAARAALAGRVAEVDRVRRSPRGELAGVVGQALEGQVGRSGKAVEAAGGAGVRAPLGEPEPPEPVRRWTQPFEEPALLRPGVGPVPQHRHPPVGERVEVGRR